MRAPYVLAGHQLDGIFALNFARRHPRDVAGVALIDSMHPEKSESLCGMQPILAMLPTLAGTGLARLFVSPGEGDPTRQAQRFVRDVAEMRAELAQAARLKSLGCRRSRSGRLAATARPGGSHTRKVPLAVVGSSTR